MSQSLTWKLDDLVGPGTALRGKITVSFTELVEVFGEPNVLNAEPSGDNKVFNEWGLQFELGKPEDDDWDLVEVTIYDWKEPHDSVSHYGNYMWHIGGRDRRSVDLVYEALGYSPSYAMRL